MSGSLQTGLVLAGVAGAAATAAFWAGMVCQDALYTDQCLDMGGGRIPGGHALCVVEHDSSSGRRGVDALAQAPAPPDDIPDTGHGVQAAAFTCDDGAVFTMLFVAPERAIVDRGPHQQPVEMTQIQTASGAKYASGDDFVWIKGAQALRGRGDGQGEQGTAARCIARRL